jgi:hypothetical protein
VLRRVQDIAVIEREVEVARCTLHKAPVESHPEELDAGLPLLRERVVAVGARPAVEIIRAEPDEAARRRRGRGGGENEREHDGSAEDKTNDAEHEKIQIGRGEVGPQCGSNPSAWPPSLRR